MESSTERFILEQTQKTGSPHGVMPPEEFVVACTQKWSRIRDKVAIEDRLEFEPYLEALLGRVATTTGEISKLVAQSNR